ncbi:MAG: YdeI/OmpD-associated family protein [Rubellimicrobium sp.]|nr:YdeI/OmpD-associated family protein [Rubellimicrobium sp.]
MDRGGASVDEFLAGITRWREEAAALCALLEDEGLAGTIKWGAPCYVTTGGNVALIQRMKDYCALAFVRGALLDDPAGVLTRPGTHRSLRQIRLRSLSEIEAMAPVIRDHIRRAIALTQEGRRIAPVTEGDIPMPDELNEALAADPDLAGAFDALTPGRRRSWMFHIGAARQSATRDARIARGRDLLLSGRGPDGR